MTEISGELSLAEVDRAGRNHALLLETLDYPIAPTGLTTCATALTFLGSTPGSFRLDIDGLVERPLSLGLEESLSSCERDDDLDCLANLSGVGAR